MIMKKRHSSIRLDIATQEIVEKYRLQFGESVSVNETVQRLIQAADDKKFVTVVSSQLSHSEELAFLAGQLEKTKLLWREVKSRLQSPRPMDPNDEAALKQWRAEREKIGIFYKECDTLFRKARALSEVLTTTSADEWLNMQDLALQLHKWTQECQKAADKESNPAKRKAHLDYKMLYENVVVFLHRVGIEPTPPEDDPVKK